MLTEANQKLIQELFDFCVDNPGIRKPGETWTDVAARTPELAALKVQTQASRMTRSDIENGLMELYRKHFGVSPKGQDRFITKRYGETKQILP